MSPDHVIGIKPTEQPNMNPELVGIENLKSVNLLLVENDSELGSFDKISIETALSEMGKMGSLDDFKIEYFFEAFCNAMELFEKIKQFDHIITHTTFIEPETVTMFENLMYMAQRDNLRDKKIFILMQKHKLHLEDEIIMKMIKLDRENNISFYVLPKTIFNNMVKIDSIYA